jgi:hypothetical protein
VSNVVRVRHEVADHPTDTRVARQGRRALESFHPQHGDSPMRVILSLIVLSSLAFAPAPFHRPMSNADLATAGLRPFTPETGNLSLADFKRLIHPLKADLVITKVVLSNERPKVGELIGATIFYKNIGGKQAKNFYLREEPNTLGEGGWGLGGDYAQLAPGQEKQYTWGAIRAKTVGVHTLTFSIDPNGSVDESNRRNNRLIIRVKVVAPGE